MRKLAALALTALMLFGCASVAPTKIPGDDATVVRAVQAEKVLFNTANTLFYIERGQQAQLVTAPGLGNIHIYAETERTEVQRLVLTLRLYVKNYRISTVKPDIMPIVTRAEQLSVELQGWLDKVALSDIPPPAMMAKTEATPTGNPYVDALVELVSLANTALSIYQQNKTQAAANGVLIDADEVAFHAREDAAFTSPYWQI